MKHRDTEGPGKISSATTTVYRMIRDGVLPALKKLDKPYRPRFDCSRCTGMW